MNPYRILVVEDEAIVAMDIEARLQALGYAIAGRASSGEQALALVAAERPDLVLMDIHLQGEMDGIAAAEEIRRRHERPVIFLTAYSEDATLERAKLTEPFGFILKPFEDRELKSAITIALHKHQAEEELRRMTRLYNVLSHVNQAIIRIRSREELLRTMCQLLVKHGAIDLAWIGVLNPATSRITAEAYFGSQLEILQKATFYANDLPEGQSNPGKAIREERPFVCNECGVEECLYPAEMAPARFGFHACASLPLRFQGRVWGTLNLCSSEVGFFREREVALLEEVAADISFGLDLIEEDRQRRRVAAEQELTAEVLGLINNASDSRVLLRSVLAVLKRWSGCEAVGIRLHDGLDYPYFETSGFAEVFVRLENTLCQYDAQGHVVRDATGTPILECMCGNILQGRTDPSKSFFTSNGSFWSNATSELLATTTEADRLARTRNRCNGAGYESVALIPLRADRQTFGLIQLNDKRRGLFTADTIALFERLAVNVANFLDKRRLADQLVESEVRLRALGDNLPDSYLYQYSHDRDGQPRFLHLSAGVARINGVGPEAVLADARLLLGQIDPAQQPAYAEAEAKSAAEECDFTMTLHMRRADGVWRWVQLRSRPRRRGDGTVIWDGVATDISEQHEAEAQIRKLSAAVEQSPTAVVITDLRGNIEYVNPAFTRVTGYSLAEAIGQNPRILQSGETPVEVYQELWQAISAGREWRGLFRNRHKNGSLFWERAIIAPLRQADGAIHHYLAVKEDVTVQKALEEQLRQAQKMEAIGTLAGGIAHDFNNMLAVILGFADLAQDEAEPDSNLWTCLENILKAGHRAKDLVRQILAFSRQSQVTRLALTPQPIVKEALKMLRAAIPTTIEIQSQIAADCGAIDADPTQLHQVLMNLCTNAFQAMEGTGGTLRVEMRPATAIPPSLGDKAGPEARFIELAVSDTGPGIGPDIVERIFDPFFTTKAQGRGTGMGLAIVHGIMEEYGGAITVDTELGRGTTFHAYFPQSKGEGVLPADELSGQVIGGTERILLIDDEALFLELSRGMLEHLGYQVSTEERAIEALATFQEQPDRFDLVITDQTMPVMTGLDLASHMLAIRADLPIILCTGYSSQVDEEVARSRGIKAFALKPLTRTALATLVRQALNGTAGRQGS